MATIPTYIYEAGLRENIEVRRELVGRDAKCPGNFSCGEAALSGGHQHAEGFEANFLREGVQTRKRLS